MRRLCLRICFGFALAIGLGALPAFAEVGYRATVQDDGTLLVDGKTVRLFGIYIPIIGYTCSTNIRPKRCAPRAVLELDFKVNGLVRCETKQKHNDGSISAVCYTLREREDLGAWMLYQGWAVALPGAPIEYSTLERIAYANGRGYWGFQADSIQRKRRR